ATPTDREAGQRPKRHGQDRDHRPHVYAVRELVPEVLQIPVALGQDTPEALDRPDPRPDVIGEHVALGLERDHHHVVDGHDRPHDEHDREQQGPRGLEMVAAAHGTERTRCRSRRGESRLGRDRAHSCTSAVRSLRIRTITSGITIGSADITAATPSRGWAISKALRMPSVASTCVWFAGPPPETKVTALKSPSRKIVDSSVQIR